MGSPYINGTSGEQRSSAGTSGVCGGVARFLDAADRAVLFKTGAKEIAEWISASTTITSLE